MLLEKPTLLLNDNIDKDNIIKQILETEYDSIDKKIPNTRIRGTKIEKPVNNVTKIIGWQRNISSIGEKIVSLPTIITMEINKNKKIKSIQLHESFNGSKSPICNQKYLNDKLQILIGKNLVTELRQYMKLDIINCFHIPEVLNGVYSFYKLYTNEIKNNNNIKPYEEETLEGYRDNDDFIMVIIHKVSVNKIVEATIILHDVFKNINYTNNGLIHYIKEIEAELILNGKSILKEAIDENLDKEKHSSYCKFLHKCSIEIKNKLFSESDISFYNTNTTPHALLGLSIQAIGLILFNKDRNALINMLNMFQRHNNQPICIGGIINPLEAVKFFPGLEKELTN